MSDKVEHKHTRIEFCKHHILGPFQFLILTLITSELLLGMWMLGIMKGEDGYYERIVVGSFSITVLIAVLVIFCVIYNIKKKEGDFKN